MVRKAIIDLYLNVKIRSQEEIQGMSDEAMDQEKANLNCIDTLDIIDYIKQSVEILMHMRIDEFEQFKNNWNTQEKLRRMQIQLEKDCLKEQIRNGINQKKKKQETQLFEKIRYELLSDQSSLASFQEAENIQISNL